MMGFLKIEEVTDSKGNVREVVVRPDSVGVIIYHEEWDSYLFVGQERPVGEYLLEIVAGYVEPGESGRSAAHREVLEETGYRVNTSRFTPLYPSFYLSPGYSTECMTLFWVNVRETDKDGPGGGVGSEGENLNVVEIPAKKIRVWDALDAKTRIAMYEILRGPE